MFPSYAQEKVVLNGDTLVTITPKQLGTINEIIVRYEYGQKEIELKDSIISLDNRSLVLKDSIIVLQKNNILLQEIINEDLKRKSKINVRKSIFISSGVGIVVGLLIGLFAR